MKQQPSPTVPDFRIFGFTELGQIRANLYRAGLPDAGSLYSWLVCSAPKQLANKLADQWEQSLTEEEFDTIDQLESAKAADDSPYFAEVEIECDECGANGVDPGNLSVYEPEECRVCHGTKRATVTRNYLSEAFAITPGQSDRPIERHHLMALDAYSRQVVSAYAQKVAA